VHPKTLTGARHWRFEVRPVPARMILVPIWGMVACGVLIDRNSRWIVR
jgi:hypothetical protein